jgi:hypothetical protein
MTKADQITIEFINNPEADVNRLAKRYKTAPSYIYKMRLRAMRQLADDPLKPEQDAAMDKLAETSRKLEELSITMSNTDEGWIISRPVNINSPMDVQIAGNHYKGKRIQPVEYIHANNLNFLEGCIVKRISRWRDKDGFQDLEKIKHEVDLLIEMEKKYAKQ